MTGKLVVLLGGDGSGKSTVLQGLRERRPLWTIASIDPHDLYPLDGLEHMNWALDTHPAVYVSRMRPLERSTYMAHTLALMIEHRIVPQLSKGNNVLCDSYFYRILAKEHALDSPGESLVAALAAAAPVADHAIWLSLDATQAWQRSGNECGFYETIGPANLEGFLRMQNAVRQHVLGTLLAGVPATTVDAAATHDQVLQRVVTCLDAVGAATPSSGPA